jgi:fluoride exporter
MMPRAFDVVASVAAGSALGGLARYLLAVAVQNRTTPLFPIGTLVVNVVGCLMLGFLMRLILDTGEFSPAARAFVTLGFCGGFTTFSSFAYEAVAAAEEGALRRALAYVGSSVVLGLLAVWLGSAAARLVLDLVRGRSA